MIKPVVGILPVYDRNTNYCRIDRDYLSAISEAGGMPILLPLTEDVMDLTWYVDHCDGILIPGGCDIQPELYGDDSLSVCGETCSIMDSMQLKVVHHILQTGTPALCICRGLQLLNVALGGTLYQDLNSQKPQSIEHRQSNPYNENSHMVYVKKESVLNMITGISSMSVNSIHHQGIKTLGSDLEVMAHSADGLVEAISYKHQIIAFQWHPEKLVKNDPIQMKIFTSFIERLRH